MAAPVFICLALFPLEPRLFYKEGDGIKRLLPLYTAVHFCVDFSCFCLLFSALPSGFGPYGAVAFLLYNGLAFGLQPLFGFFCDLHPRFPAAILGCLFTAGGMLTAPLPFLGLLLCGLGNALFHVDGGRQVLLGSLGQTAPSGIFVSSGALGVALGTLWGAGQFSLLFPFALMLLSALWIFLCRGEAMRLPPRTQFSILTQRIPIGLLVLLCFLAVMVRSLAGSFTPSINGTTPFFFLLPYLAAALGKLAGGIFAQRLSPALVGVGSLLLSLPLLCFGGAQPVLLTLGLFFVQFPMAITLCALAQAFPHHPGLAFGITTFGLLLGSLFPTFFVLNPVLAPPVLSALLFFAALCLFLVLLPSNKE